MPYDISFGWYIFSHLVVGTFYSVHILGSDRPLWFRLLFIVSFGFAFLLAAQFHGLMDTILALLGYTIASAIFVVPMGAAFFVSAKTKRFKTEYGTGSRVIEAILVVLAIAMLILSFIANRTEIYPPDHATMYVGYSEGKLMAFSPALVGVDEDIELITDEVTAFDYAGFPDHGIAVWEVTMRYVREYEIEFDELHHDAGGFTEDLDMVLALLERAKVISPSRWNSDGSWNY